MGRIGAHLWRGANSTKSLLIRVILEGTTITKETNYLHLLGLPSRPHKRSIYCTVTVSRINPSPPLLLSTRKYPSLALLPSHGKEPCPTLGPSTQEHIENKENKVNGSITENSGGATGYACYAPAYPAALASTTCICVSVKN